uniref:Uncharacterized protein n=1 Tax=Oryza meridionalis TaxID=40149 RepID=A0A0E0CKF9_9ORYZ
MAATSSPGKVAVDPQLPSLDLACPRLDSTDAGGAVARRDGGGVADDEGGRCVMAREAGTKVAEGGTREAAPTVTPSPAAKAARREPACEARMREAMPIVALSDVPSATKLLLDLVGNMVDTDVFDAPVFNFRFLFRPARPPPLLDAPLFCWPDCFQTMVMESSGGSGEVFIREVGPACLWSGLFGLAGHAPFEGILGENPACYSKIGDIDACGDVSSLEVLPR